MSNVSKSQIQFATVLVKVLQWFPGALEQNLDAFSDTQGLPSSYTGLFGYISDEFFWFHVRVNAYLFFKSEVTLPCWGVLLSSIMCGVCHSLHLFCTLYSLTLYFPTILFNFLKSYS